MKVSRKGQVTIPKHLRERFGMHQNVEVVVSPTAGGVFICTKEMSERISGPAFHINRTRIKSDEEARRLSRILNSKEKTEIPEDHPINRVVGILDKNALGEGVSVDEYIEEIRGR